MVSRYLLLVLAVLVACAPAAMDVNDTNRSNVTVNNTNETMPVPVVDRGTPVEERNYSVIVTGVEGEVIELDSLAIDPDNDTVSYEFSGPFDENGMWQTRRGDAGDYHVTVTAFDGVERIAQQILVRVFEKNKLPILSCPERIRVLEGEEIRLGCDAVDPEGDEVIIQYHGYTSISRVRPTYDEEGTHTVFVKAWDKQNVDKKVNATIIIEVINVNRPPHVSFDFGTTIRAKEGEIVRVEPEISDPDGDVVDAGYSEPFNSNGIWETEVGDAGSYDAMITVTDGEDVVRRTFTVILETVNTAPVMAPIDDIRVDEGERVELDIVATDREGDDISIDISGFMESASYTTTYDDAYPDGCSEKLCTAEYTVTITATDGRAESSQDVSIFIKDRNRPPVFKIPA